MSYFVRTNVEPLQAWRIDSRVAVLLGVANPMAGAGTYFEAGPGETIWDAIRKGAAAWFEPHGKNPFVQTELGSGEYFARIARPLCQHLFQREAYAWYPGAERDVVATAVSQQIALLRQLDRICQTVHPVEKNLNAFGHDIRNLLILACTEVENHWRGVVAANGFCRERYSTNDYVRLKAPMRLEEYAVTFPNYPWLPVVRPFASWSDAQPTESLKWYDAYNATKHAREVNFERATLRQVFEAITACEVMLVAQFGMQSMRSELSSFFQFAATPKWDPSEVYIFPYDLQGWTPVPFRF